MFLDVSSYSLLRNNIWYVQRLQSCAQVGKGAYDGCPTWLPVTGIVTAGS